MRKLITVLAMVLMVGCTTTEKKKDYTKEKAIALNNCRASMAYGGVPQELAAVFCPCMVEQLGKDVPDYNREKAIKWLSDGSSSIADILCTNEVEIYLNSLKKRR